MSVAKGLAYLMPGAVGKGLPLGPERHGPKLIALLSSCVSRELPESNLSFLICEMDSLTEVSAGGESDT